MSQSELSDTSVAGESRENIIQDWEEQPEVVISKLYSKMEEIEDKLDKAVGGDQPDGKDQIQVWNHEQDIPGDPKIFQLIKELRNTNDQGLNRLSTAQIEQIVERKRTRTLEIMSELASNHDKIVMKNHGGNKGKYLYWKP